MPRRADSPGQRRQLLGDIKRLAEVAIFGTLSETYRTCGHPGCHCHGPGPKHGPHLHVSYRGERGKTSGYYVPKAAEQATRQGVVAWQKLQECLRKLAALNKERNFPARPRGRLAVKRWLGLALAGLGVCLLLALGHPEVGRGMDRHPRIAPWGRSVGPWGEPALALPAAALAQNPGPRQAPPGVSESLSVELMLLTERDVGPPWLDSRGPPGKVRGTWVDSRAAGQIGSPESKGKFVLPQQGPSTPEQAPLREGGFATAFS